MTTMANDVDRLAHEREGEFFSRSMIEYPTFLRDEAEWLIGRLEHYDPDVKLDDDEAARLAVAVTSIEVRDVAWNLITNETAEVQGQIWADLMDRVPDRLMPAVASLLGFAAWMTRRNQLGILAVGVALHVDPSYRMAHLVRTAILAQMSPEGWDPPERAEWPLVGNRKSKS